MALGASHVLFFLDCPAGQWGPDCQSSCEPCANGGQCNRETGACDCPPGYTGASCSVCKSSHQPFPCKESQFENSAYGLISTFLLFCEMLVTVGTLIQDKLSFSFRNSQVEFDRICQREITDKCRWQAKLHPKLMLSLDLIYGNMYLEIQCVIATILAL